MHVMNNLEQMLTKGNVFYKKYQYGGRINNKQYDTTINIIQETIISTFYFQNDDLIGHMIWECKSKYYLSNKELWRKNDSGSFSKFEGLKLNWEEVWVEREPPKEIYIDICGEHSQIFSAYYHGVS